MPWTIIAGRDRAQGEMGTRITIGEPEKREEEDADCICCCRVESVLDQSVPALGAWSDGLAISIRDASYFPQKNSNRLHLLRRPGSMYFVFFYSEFARKLRGVNVKAVVARNGTDLGKKWRTQIRSPRNILIFIFLVRP